MSIYFCLQHKRWVRSFWDSLAFHPAHKIINQTRRFALDGFALLGNRLPRLLLFPLPPSALPLPLVLRFSTLNSNHSYSANPISRTVHKSIFCGGPFNRPDELHSLL